MPPSQTRIARGSAHQLTKAIRLMVGLQYLKYAFDESDESVVERWVENPYWQYFCGFTHMQREAPIDPGSMSRWRKRVGAERLEVLLTETIELAVRHKQLSKRDPAQVTVDYCVLVFALRRSAKHMRSIAASRSGMLPANSFSHISMALSV